MSKQKNFVNPYLLLLAKRMIDYDFVGIGGVLSDSGLRSCIYDRYKSPDFLNTNFSDRNNDRSARGRARTFYQHNLLPLWSFKFSLLKLDELVREIKTLEQFESWEKFKLRYSFRDPYYDIAQERLEKAMYNAKKANQKEITFSQLDKDLFLQHANMKLFELHSDYILLDKINSHRYLSSTSDFVIRSANPEEIPIIIKMDRNKKTEFFDESSNFLKGNTFYTNDYFDFLETKIRSDYIDFTQAIKSHHAEHRNIFFIQRSKKNEIKAALIYIPLIEEMYTSLKLGKLSLQAIENTHFDFIRTFKPNVYCYFEYSTQNDAALETKYYFNLELKHAIGGYYRKETIGTKAYSSHEESNLRQLGFNPTYKGTNAYDSRAYTFWEFVRGSI